MPNEIFEKIFQKMSFRDAISMRFVDGVTTLDKFGENPVINTTDTPVDLWEQNGIYSFSTTSAISTLSSSSDSDIGHLILIKGIKSPILSTGEDVGYSILNGRNKVLIYDNPALNGDPITFWRTDSMENESDSIEFSGAGDLTGTVYCYEDTAISAGVPIDSSKIRAIISDENNETLMTIYTSRPKHVTFLYRGEISLSRSVTVGSAQISYCSRRYRKVFKVKKRIDLVNSGSTVYQDERSFPDIIPALTDIKFTIENVSMNDTGITGTFDVGIFEERLFSNSFLSAIGQPGY